MITVDYGGNRVQSFGDSISHSEFSFSKFPYEYFTYHLQHEERIFEAKACLIYFQSGDSATITFKDGSFQLSPGDAFFCDGLSLKLNSRKGHFFIVACEGSSDTFFEYRQKDQLKVVTKPWGKEIWINHPSQSFSLKEIHINSGTKTSLQYHQFKTETNVIFSGKAKLYFKSNPKIENNQVSAEDLGEAILKSGDVMHVTPENIHRLEAITDLILLEASTNHLDDVIRIQDDFKRTHGRIESEHENK